MPALIKDFSGKRLVEYLKPGMRVLVKFDWHGVGDMIMFQPLYQKLKQLYPDVEFHLKGNSDHQYFYETPEAPVDIIFDITFRETTGIRDDGHFWSKPEYCAVKELGIPWEPSLEFSWKPDKWNTDLKIKDNCIGFIAQVQSCPDKGLAWDTAMFLWNRIKAKGFTPIEVTFRNLNKNAKNGKCSFIDYTCRDMEPTVENMISVIKQCKGFVGVNTGTFCAATCIMDGHVLHLYKRHHFGDFYKRHNPVPEMDCTKSEGLDFTVLDDYLESCRDSNQPR